MRLRSLLTCLSLLVPAACGSSVGSGSPAAGADDPQQLRAEGCKVPAGLPFRPTWVAHEGDMPPAGSYRSPTGPVAIPHTPVMCGQVFKEVLDFTHLGTWRSCVDDPSAPEERRRPCYEGFRAHPDQRAELLNTLPDGPKPAPNGGFLWRPREGQTLMVVCQMTGNANLQQGSQRDSRGEPSRSNIWNKIKHPDIENGGVGWINDIWMGNAGFRGLPCPSGDAF